MTESGVCEHEKRGVIIFEARKQGVQSSLSTVAADAQRSDPCNIRVPVGLQKQLEKIDGERVSQKPLDSTAVELLQILILPLALFPSLSPLALYSP